MSAIARAIIGEDEELRRLAMSGLPQDRMRLLKMKRAFESLGYSETHIYQRQDKHREHDHWTVMTHPKDILDWSLLPKNDQDWKGTDLLREVLKIAGYQRVNPYNKIYVRSWHTGPLELVFLMPRIGKFNGYLRKDNKFVHSSISSADNA